MRQITVCRTSAIIGPGACCSRLRRMPFSNAITEAYLYFRLRGRLAQLLTQPSIALSGRVTLPPQLALTEMPVTVLIFPAGNAFQQSLTCSLASDPHFHFTSSIMVPHGLCYLRRT